MPYIYGFIYIQGTLMLFDFFIFIHIIDTALSMSCLAAAHAVNISGD